MPKSHTTCEDLPLLAALHEELEQRRHVPVATYRLQLNADFPFERAQALVPYLHALGITDCYASPYLKARPGSPHGYDVVDPCQINPEIGTEAEHAAFVQTLQQHGMGQLLDIVPNHLGVIGGENTWWQDVLAHGQASVYARFFDINWQPDKAALRHKVLLPILGAPYGEVLEQQEFCLDFDAGAFVIHYYEHHMPVAPETTTGILHTCLLELQQHLGATDPQTLALQDIITALGHLPQRTHPTPEAAARRQREATGIRQRLVALYASSAALQSALSHTIQAYNGTRDEPRSFDRLHDLLEAQSYRLSYWRVANDELNYRRFFDIVHLAGVRVEEPAVFAATHDLILQWLDAGSVTGLRIDHPDGLWDPEGYVQRLQHAYVRRCARRLCMTRSVPEPETKAEALAAQYMAAFPQDSQSSSAWPLYVVVEKILEAEETLPIAWPVYGTTGYDVLQHLNGLFVDGTHAEAFRALYADFIGDSTPFADVLYVSKKLILQTSLASELAALASQLECLAETNRRWRDVSRAALAAALQEMIACFPVYRTYIRSGDDTVHPADRLAIETALAHAKPRCPEVHVAVLEMIRDILLQRESTLDVQNAFISRFQQLTGPVMAKGLEDTAFYRYTPLASLNEVGGDADRFGMSVEAFHQHNIRRQQHWPHTLVATSTHDTKRSEDVRARLNVLSEIPHEWRTCLWRWARLNAPHKMAINGRDVPSRQEEYLLYQTLLGAWPLEPYSAAEMVAFRTRIQAYMRKALREAKVHTSWVDPQSAYEAAVDRFVETLLDEQTSAAFLQDFRAMQQTVAHVGMWNALAQMVLKLTIPGVPDIYQGCELWDLSLVDPDNRRPVDYAQRQRLLDELQQRCQEPDGDGDRVELVHDLLRTRVDGCIKLYVLWQLLTCRRTHAPVFLQGDYVPLVVEGDQREHVCAFARLYGDEAVLVLVPRLLTRLTSQTRAAPLGHTAWGTSCVVLPETLAGATYRQLLTGQIVYPVRAKQQATLPLATVFTAFPIAVLQRLNGP